MCRSTSEESCNKVVLPSDARPEKYNIHLTPNFDSFTFAGTTRINYTIVRSTDTIQLHAKDLLIASGVTFKASNEVYEAISVSVGSDTVLKMKFGKDLPVGSGVLKVEFTGTLNDQMAGFYRSGYVDAMGQKRHMATTQLEAIDARRMFPCVDEPSAKAVFELHVTAPAELTVLSNMPEKRKTYRKVHSESHNSTYLVQDVHFMPSPRMSTYLVACCIGQFEFVQAVTNRGTLVRVLCTPGKAKECEFALEVGVGALEFYEDFFDLPYPLPKMDMIAIPDFAMGAMENWGLITYREIDLLCDKSTVSVARKTRLGSVVAHEIAHQWFGNLVTMDWWDDLWLNEGFASFMQNYCCDALYPAWGMWDEYVCDDLDRARGLDGLRSSHPIQVPIPRAEDVEQVFDAISYCKGAAVVRLAFNVLGEPVFKAGLRAYMKKHAYGNTVTSDLWSALQTAADAAAPSGVVAPNVAELMGSWTRQMGYPFLTVVDSDASKKSLEIQQGWFLSDGSVLPDDEKKIWQVPLFVNNDQLHSILKKKKEVIEVVGEGLIKLNYNESAPIRVLYQSKSLMDALLIGVQDKQLTVPNRIGLLSDTRAFARAGKLSVDDVLELLKAFRDEDNVNVWSAIESSIGGISSVVSLGLGRKEEFGNFVMFMAKDRLNQLGWDSRCCDSDADRHSRSILLRIVGTYCSSGDTDIINEARRRFNAYKEDQSTGLLSDDTRTAVLRVVLSNPENEESDWSWLKSVAESSKTSQTAKLNIYSALGFVKSSKLKRATLDWCLTDALKTQDFFYPMMSVNSSNEEGAEIAWNWLNDNFELARARLAKASPSLLASVLRCCASGSIKESRADEIQAKYGNIAVLTRTVANMVEATKASAAYVERSKDTRAAKDTAFWTRLCKQ